MSFLNFFTQNAQKYPDKVALEFIDPPLQRVTYAELDDLVDRTANYLHNLGVQPSDRVSLQLSKCLEFILLHLATIRLGAITLPLNIAYPPDELKYFLEDSGAKLFFAPDSNRGNIQSILPNLPDLQKCIFLDPAEPDKFQSLITGIDTHLDKYPEIFDQQSNDDTVVIIYTSGTTGRPKGAQITHGNLVSNLQELHKT